MKFIIVFVALFAIAVAAPPAGDVQVLKSESIVDPESYQYALETSDGTSKQEKGELKNVGTDDEAIVVHGSYSWVDEKTGEKFTVTYTADENGYQPQGAHIPQAA